MGILVCNLLTIYNYLGIQGNSSQAHLRSSPNLKPNTHP